MESSETSGEGAGEATAFSERPSSSRLVERDVEAPEVFQTTDQGLWDGRPSLGGVWVAYPDATDPERVIIRNEANGKFVIGALFKREREHPGPKLQVSSDAAAALGMLAGSPTTLDVTALRREAPAAPVEEQAEQAVAAASDKNDDTKAISEEAAADGADEAAAVAGAAVAAVAAETPKKSGWNPFRRKSSNTAASEDVVAGAETEAVQAEAPVARSEAADKPLIEAAVAEAPSDPAVVPAAEPAKKKSGWNPFRRKSTESVTPVAASAAVGTAALATGEITSQSLDSAPRAVAAEAASAPDALKTNSKLDKPFVQIGIFSVEDNAQQTAKALRKNGVVPTIYQQESSGKTFWRVVAGPSASKVDRSALLKKVKAMGYADAYPVGG